MQQEFTNNPDHINNFKSSISNIRFERYLNNSQSKDFDAIMLYRWNTLVSQSLYTYLQAWEICLRNKLNAFLMWKYNDKWPFDDARACRNFKSDDIKRVQEAVTRQKSQRNTQFPSTSSIVSDLSAGFWVSQLSRRYSVPYSWQHNIKRIFPNDSTMTEIEAREICDDLLKLRNRIAHHEPIFHLPLDELHQKLSKIILAMCEATSIFAINTCNFEDVWKQRPINSKVLTPHA
jgi:hypothetical protein